MRFWKKKRDDNNHNDFKKSMKKGEKGTGGKKGEWKSRD